MLSVFFISMQLFVFSACQSDGFDFAEESDYEQQSVTEMEYDEIVEPFSFYEISGNRADVYIRTDVPKANIYLNGIYQGRTPLRLKNLIPGYYSLKIEFSQNDNESVIKSFMVELETAKLKEYYIEK